MFSPNVLNFFFFIFLQIVFQFYRFAQFINIFSFFFFFFSLPKISIEKNKKKFCKLCSHSIRGNMNQPRNIFIQFTIFFPSFSSSCSFKIKNFFFSCFQLFRTLAFISQFFSPTVLACLPACLLPPSIWFMIANKYFSLFNFILFFQFQFRFQWKERKKNL